MKLKILAIAPLLTPLWLAIPVQAQNANLDRSNKQVLPPPPTAGQVLSACLSNRADTLPIPFTDVSPDHWAFKAVMTMYYCGAFREATPPSSLQRLTTRNSPPPQSEQTLPSSR